MAMESGAPHDAIFVSCVSRELHGDTTPGASTWPGSYRTAIANFLDKYGLRAVFQERFTETGGDTLSKLDAYIAGECKAVIHLLGMATGTSPSQDELTTFMKSHSDFLANRSELLTLLKEAGLGSFSYTQWEALLAIHYAIDLFIFRLDEHAARAPDFSPDPEQIERQARHRARLEKSGFYGFPVAYNDTLQLCCDLALALNKTAIDKPQTQTIHQLPYRSLDNLFKGRSLLFKQVADAFQRSTASVVALHGAGGIGKTRAAIEYAWQHQKLYDVMLFVVAENPERFESQLRSLAGVLDVGLTDAKNEVQVTRVLGWFQSHRRWLLIIDNVDDAATRDAIQQRLSALSQGNVLITSRLKDWPTDVEALPIDLLAIDEAVEFLLDDKNNSSRRRHAADDEAAARDIAITVGRLPLGLTQARSYVSVKRTTYRDYLQRYRSNNQSIIDWFDPKMCLYPREIAVAWKTSTDQLSSEARALLQILAWFGPEPIPESLFDDFPEALSRRIPDPLEALRSLDALSLAEMNDVDPPTFWIHRLIQDTTRREQLAGLDGRIAPAALSDAVAWLMHVLEADKLKGDPRVAKNRAIFRELLPHAITLADFANQYGQFEGYLYSFSSLVAFLLGLPIAESIARRALEGRERHLSPDHSDTLASVFNLSVILEGNGDLPAAEAYCRRALEGFQRINGPTHRDTLMSINRLGHLRTVRGDLVAAEPLFQQALDGFQRHFDPEDENRLQCEADAAQFYQAKGDLIRAEALCRSAFEKRTKVLGSDHPDTLTSLNDLAMIMRDKGDLATAEAECQRALDARARILGRDNRETLTSLNNLGLVIQAKGDLTQAACIYRNAHESRERVLGPSHPDTLVSAECLSVLMKMTGDLKQGD
ncbi:MAG TPA: tetratricopeptide repeat protein [Pirellulales bacterium]|jgi:tetratricopeptide (TPR) repeat protein|nr:tetratricopeptide repeat protein [Pirellulales bacterium]